MCPILSRQTLGHWQRVFRKVNRLESAIPAIIIPLNLKEPPGMRYAIRVRPFLWARTAFLLEPASHLLSSVTGWTGNIAKPHYV